MDLDVADCAVCEEAVDGGFIILVIHEILRNEAAAWGIRFQRARAGAELLGKTGAGVIARAIFFVNVDGARLREKLDAGETIVREKNAAVDAWFKCLQTVTARSVVRGEFSVRGKTVERCAESLANFVGDSGRNSFNTERVHGGFPFVRHVQSLEEAEVAIYPERVFKLERRTVCGDAELSR